MDIKGAIFDMDGTLVDSMILWDVFWKMIGDKYFGGAAFRPETEIEEKMRTMTLEQVAVYLHENYSIGKNAQDLLEDFSEALLEFYRNQVRPKRGVVEYLEYLSSKGVKMCVASATEGRLIAVALERCGLLGYFGKIFSCYDIGKGKDKPDIYFAALDFLGTKKEETWIFEDAYVAIHTAREIGINTVGIYDAQNPFQDKIEKEATEYIRMGETLEKLIK